jgi:glycosyltransferase involved in cell wall biosynthesis
MTESDLATVLARFSGAARQVGETAAASEDYALEVSVVMPCLNEADTVGSCVAKARQALESHGLAGEVIVADNGSSDDSRGIAERAGARVVPVAGRGYGSALMGGISAARGRYVIMGDADDSYDFGQVPRFVERLREGYDLVQGCRLPSGGGQVLPGAMPLLHRIWGNPMFSLMARRWFRAPIHDVHCGMRGFTAGFYRRMDLRCTGMEFASEMIIKATLQGARIGEVPITLHPDGRTSHPPHLRTFRDGWRHLWFYLVYSPRWLFLYPGLALILLGLLCYAIAMPRLTIGHVTFDVHTLLFGSLFVICGYQSILFAVFAKVFAITERLLPEDPRMTRLFRIVTLEKGLIAGGLAIAAGALCLAVAVGQWWATGFGPLDYDRTMRWVIPGVTITALGFQTLLSSFFLSVLGLRRQ